MCMHKVRVCDFTLITPHVLLTSRHSSQDRQTMLAEMESTGKWPKSANQELFRTGSAGAPGFVSRFNLAVAAFMAHRVSMYSVCVMCMIMCDGKLETYFVFLN